MVGDNEGRGAGHGKGQSYREGRQNNKKIEPCTRYLEFLLYKKGNAYGRVDGYAVMI